ncbi:DUF1190 domain-containing protein [Xanthomonas maliensis]|uniref:DUF1190 domain-containing protein n=1 Tax=Xanthomonas maliensis TaxID=1321368 RepID=UPI0003A5C810|nr:DUF1190 domain-containing protein [Xanthomonas maliensis]KAB7763771.1 DUF1190 domain-containing protein [Xanthomonas maliensis]
MKRSRNLKLTLMAAVPAALLTGCGSEPETGVVLQSASDCYQLKQEQGSIEQCLKAYDEATAKHRQSAPRFGSRYECDAQFGSCTEVDEQGQHSWIPPMGGFLLGYALGNMTSGGSYGYRYGGAIPLYRDYRSGGFYKPNGDLASDRIGTVRGRSGAIDMPTRAITVSRSGFGSSAAARSSFGGGRSSGFGG